MSGVNERIYLVAGGSYGKEHLGHPIKILEAALERAEEIVEKQLSELTSEPDPRNLQTKYNTLNWWTDKRDMIKKSIEILDKEMS